MCSIAGIYCFQKPGPGERKLKEKVQGALDLLSSRGPDEASITTVRDYCVMGGNRLIIRGHKDDGSSPFKFNRNYSYYNGEIYSHQQHEHDGESDGRVVLPLYAEMGAASFARLDGEFAISIWDEQQERVVLARDPFGTKPFFFSIRGHQLLWASSASAINAMEKHPYCAAVKGPTYQHSFAVQEPYTSYQGIWLLPPGHYIIADKNGARLYTYHQWSEASMNSLDTSEAFDELESSLKSRLMHKDVIGIPMSAGIDSGIIAFMADLMGVKYHIFSITEIFGEKTEETENIMKRIDRLKNPTAITILKCNEPEYQAALKDMFQPQYYDSEKFDNGDILMHTVFNSMKQAGIRVAIDGSGGDELFHGYKFRDDFKPVVDWPQPWKRNWYYYSLFTTLLDYTSKSDRAGGFFSIESRYPFQSTALMNAASKLKVTEVLKWPLRNFLLTGVGYGQPLNTDIDGKFGFSIKNKSKATMIQDMQNSWKKQHGLNDLPTSKPIPFPFKMGQLE